MNFSRVSNDNEQFREQPIDASASNIDQAVSRLTLHSSLGNVILPSD